MLRVPNALLWAILRPLLRLILRFKLNFQAARVRVKGPFVLLCSHASWYDPLLAAVCVDRPLAFVGADPSGRRVRAAAAWASFPRAGAAPTA